MGYIGNIPAEKYSAFTKQDFSTSATTSYTLSQAVANENEIALFINFVRQEPTTAYTASGTSLTLTSATASSDDMYCVFLGKAVQTVNPPNSSVGTSQLDSSLDFSSKTITLASNMKNTPSFAVRLTSDQTVSSDTPTKIQLNSEAYDTDNAFDSSTNYRFTVPSGEAGKYYFYTQVYGSSDTGDDVVETSVFIYKNGTSQGFAGTSINDKMSYNVSVKSLTLDLSVGDYIEFYGKVTISAGTPLLKGQATRFDTHALGYKLIE